MKDLLPSTPPPMHRPEGDLKIVPGTPSTQQDQQLATTFATIARELDAEAGLAEVYPRITRAAVELIPGCDHSAISLVNPQGSITTMAATSEIPPLVDRLQHATGQGPCRDAVHTPHGICINDLGTETRWLRFTRRAVHDTSVRSILSLHLYSRDDVPGILNLYSTRPFAFDDRSHTVCSILAAHATVAITAATDHARVTQLQQAMHSNRRIGMAIGVLMATEQLTEDQALSVLRKVSQRQNIKLRDLAEMVVTTGTVPQVPHRLR